MPVRTLSIRFGFSACARHSIIDTLWGHHIYCSHMYLSQNMHTPYTWYPYNGYCTYIVKGSFKHTYLSTHSWNDLYIKHILANTTITLSWLPGNHKLHIETLKPQCTSWPYLLVVFSVVGSKLPHKLTHFFIFRFMPLLYVHSQLLVCLRQFIMSFLRCQPNLITIQRGISLLKYTNVHKSKTGALKGDSLIVTRGKAITKYGSKRI